MEGESHRNVEIRTLALLALAASAIYSFAWLP